MIARVPGDVPNLIDGADAPPAAGDWLDKRRPADGEHLCRLARSGDADVDAAVAAARRAQPAWAERTVVERGDLVREVALRPVSYTHLTLPTILLV